MHCGGVVPWHVPGPRGSRRQQTARCNTTVQDLMHVRCALWAFLGQRQQQVPCQAPKVCLWLQTWGLVCLSTSNTSHLLFKFKVPKLGAQTDSHVPAALTWHHGGSLSPSCEVHASRPGTQCSPPVSPCSPLRLPQCTLPSHTQRSSQQQLIAAACPPRNARTLHLHPPQNTHSPGGNTSMSGMHWEHVCPAHPHTLRGPGLMSSESTAPAFSQMHTT